ncbi:MAG: hypothetical protein GKC08_02450, partial [Methanosarcinales archaeon]|nr:hypothetical protein [Methanosarcinales archaeon]
MRNELKSFGIIVGTMVFAILLLGTNASAVEQIEAYDGNNWQIVSEEQFAGQAYPDYRYATKTIELPFDTTKVRLTQMGTDTAHLDCALLDGEAPQFVIDKSTDTELVPTKLTQADYDVIDAAARTIEISWANPGTVLVLAAVEENLIEGPFLWPQQGYLEYT